MITRDETDEHGPEAAAGRRLELAPRAMPFSTAL
jgi:hypothetical protein